MLYRIVTAVRFTDDYKGAQRAVVCGTTVTNSAPRASVEAPIVDQYLSEFPLTSPFASFAFHFGPPPFRASSGCHNVSHRPSSAWEQSRPILPYSIPYRGHGPSTIVHNR